jgi:hypothetical protein
MLTGTLLKFPSLTVNCAIINLSLAAAGMIYRIKGGFLYAFSVCVKIVALGSLKRLLEGFS